MICFQALSSQVAVNSMKQRYYLPYCCDVNILKMKKLDVNSWLYSEDHLMPI